MSGRFARGARIAAATVVGAALLIAIAAWALVRSGSVDVWLTDRVAALLGPRVHVGAARVLWWPRPGVALDDVAFLPTAGATEPIDAATVICRVRLDSLLSGAVELASVRIERVRVSVQRGGDGRLRAGGVDLLALATAGTGSDQHPRHVPGVRLHDAVIVVSADGTDAPPPVQIEIVDAAFAPHGHGGRIEIDARVDDKGTVELRSELTALDQIETSPFTADLAADRLDVGTLSAWLPKAAPVLHGQGQLRVQATLSGRGTTALGGTGTVELAGGALSADGWQVTAPLKLDGKASWNGSALSLSQGRAAVARLGTDAIAAESLEAAFAYADGVLHIDSAQLHAWGGAVRTSGTVRLSDPPLVDGSLEAEGIDGAQLAGGIRAFGVAEPLPRVDAPLRFTATVTGSPGGPWNGSARVETSGPVRWSQARVDGPLVLSAELETTAASAGAPATASLTNGHVQTGRVTVEGAAIDTVDGAFSYRDGSLQLAPLTAAGLGGSWTYQGAVPVGGATRWTGQLTGTRIDLRTLLQTVGAASTDPIADGSVNLSAQLTGTGTTSIAARTTVELASDSLQWGARRIDRPADVAASLRLQDGVLTLTNGQAQAQSVRAGDVTLSGLRGTYSYAGKRLQVSSLHARSFGGSVHAEGVLTMAPTLSWNGRATGTHIDLDALLDPLPGEGPHSRDAHADLQMQLAVRADGTASGTADIRMASGTFIWDDLRVEGPAHANGAFALRGDDLTVDKAAAEAAHAAFGPLTASNATAHFRYRDDRLTFADLQFHSCDGTWKHSGWVDLGPGGQFAGQLAVRGAEPREVQAMFGNTDSDFDFASADFDAQFGGRTTDDWLDDLRATGTLVLRDGTMQSAGVLRAIWEALVGSGRVTDAMNRIDRRTRVQEISATFVLREQECSTPDLTLLSDDYNVTAVGNIGLDGSLDLEARIRLTSQGIQKMLVLGSLPLPTEMLPDLPTIPTSVSGTLAHPAIRPKVSALPAATVRWMVDALLHTPRSIGGAIVHRLRQLWGGTERAAEAAEATVAPAN